jgi:hypothetical protein
LRGFSRIKFASIGGIRVKKPRVSSVFNLWLQHTENVRRANLGIACAASSRNNSAVQQFVTRSNWAAVLFALALVSKASAQADLPVYTDHLVNDFHDWHWVSHSLADTSSVHSGACSISVSAVANWQGLAIGHVGFDTSPYASLSFWANGGTKGGQRLQVQGLLGGSNPPPDVYYRFTLPPDTWQQITVPLASLGIADKTNCTGFWIQQTPDGTNGAFYVDDIKFDAKPAVPATLLNTNPITTTTGATTREGGMNWNIAGWCIVGALVVITALLAWLVVLLHRSGLGISKTPALAVSLSAPQTGLELEVDGAPVARPHLVAAEALANPQSQVLRKKIAAELAEFAKQNLVHGHHSQRNKLAEVQQKARQELGELDAQMTSLHLPLQERFRAYELRIADLEKELEMCEELEMRDEERREMTHATLLLIRERLEQEKTSGHGARRFS